MKKNMICFAILLIAHGTINAQGNGNATKEVRYIASCIRDTVKNEVLTDTFCLRYNSSVSIFFNQEKFRMDSLKHNDFEAYQAKMTNLMTIGGRKDEAGQSYCILKDNQAKTFLCKDAIGGNELRYVESVPSISWKISKDRKVIAGYKCKKASADFRGREYTVWFTDEIQEEYGPWKLGGLPGLILEASDAKNQYTFKFIDIHPCKGIIEMPKGKALKTTFADYMKEQQSYLADPIGYFEKKSVISISFGDDNRLTDELRNGCRHQPMEIIK